MINNGKKKCFELRIFQQILSTIFFSYKKYLEIISLENLYVETGLRSLKGLINGSSLENN